MPTISMFYGIIIRMFNNGREHNPPHIHAEYQGQQAVFDLDGNFPDRSFYPWTGNGLSIYQDRKSANDF